MQARRIAQLARLAQLLQGCRERREVSVLWPRPACQCGENMLRMLVNGGGCLYGLSRSAELKSLSNSATTS